MSEAKKLNYRKGALFALGGPIAGIILWVAIWQLGFIASITAFAMAWLTIWLYKKGAGGIDKKSLDVIIPYVVIGLFLAFFAIFSLDSAYYAQGEVDGLKGQGMWQLLTSANFWSFNLGSFLSPYDLGQYAVDIIMTIVFGVLGMYSTIKSVKEEAGKAGAEQKPKNASVAAAQKEESKPPKVVIQKQKKTWLAVALNLLPGAGYLYLNPKRAFGWILLVSQMLLLATLPLTWNDPAPEIPNALADALGSFGFIILCAAFMVDAYFETKRTNESAQ